MATQGHTMKLRDLLLVLAFVFAAAVPASAAPPASCASKFVGSWVVRVNATGQTYPAQFFANGRSHATCPLCTPGGSWTCSGNTLTFTVDNGVSGQATLSEDGRTMSGGCCTTTRVGAAPSLVVEKKPPSQQLSSEVVTREAKSGHQPSDKITARTPQPTTTNTQSASSHGKPTVAAVQGGNSQSCSDITGLPGAPTSQVKCQTDRRRFAVAPAQEAAKHPAAAPMTESHSSEDPASLAGTIVDELGRIRSGQSDDPDNRPAPSTPPVTAATSGNLTSGNPMSAGQRATSSGTDTSSCTAYFENMLENFKRNAAICLKDSRLIRSLTDMEGTDKSTVDDVYLTRASAPELFAYIDPLDPRWKHAGESFAPNCELPLTDVAQSESYMECARAYLCGAAAARCGLMRAREIKTNSCLPLSHECLAQHPVPQRMSSDPKPPQYVSPDPVAPLPSPPASQSTITGPSGSK